MTRFAIEGMELQEVSERDRQFGFILELHLHLDLKFAPTLLADFKWEVVDHYFNRESKNPPLWF